MTAPSLAALARLPWRPGRKLGRTLYAQLGPDPADDDPFIGIMDSAHLAALVCEAHNMTARRPREPGEMLPGEITLRRLGQQ